MNIQTEIDKRKAFKCPLCLQELFKTKELFDKHFRKEHFLMFKNLNLFNENITKETELREILKKEEEELKQRETAEKERKIEEKQRKIEIEEEQAILKLKQQKLERTTKKLAFLEDKIENLSHKIEDNIRETPKKQKKEKEEMEKMVEGVKIQNVDALKDLEQ